MIQDFRRFGASKDDSTLKAIVQGLAEDMKHVVAFKKGEMAQFGIAVAEILEVDGDQVYARLGPNTGWYDKAEIDKLGLEWKSADEFNKRDITNNNQLAEVADKKAQVVTKGGRTALKNRKADEDRPYRIVRDLQAGLVSRSVAIRMLADMAIAYPQAVTEAFQKIGITPEEVKRLQDEAQAFQVTTDEGGGGGGVATVDPTRPVSQPVIPPTPVSDRPGRSPEFVPEIGKGEPIPETIMDKYDTQKQIDKLLDRYNAGEISLEKLRYRMKDLVIRKGCRHAVRQALMERFAPRSHILDESIWGKAKAAADKSYNKSDDFYWAAVTDIYKKMGGRMKKKEGQSHKEWWSVGEMSPEAILLKAMKRLQRLIPDKDSDAMKIIDWAILNNNFETLFKSMKQLQRLIPDKDSDAMKIIDWAISESGLAARIRDMRKMKGKKKKGQLTVPDLDAKLVYTLMMIKHISDNPKVRELVDSALGEAFKVKTDESFDQSMDQPSAVASRAGQLMTPESTLYYALKTIKLMTDDPHITEIADLAIKKWDDAEKEVRDSSDLPPTEFISRPDIERGEGEDQLRPVD